ncbi:hypothetical protein [Gudongella sp. SC589]|uniref:hypothetical protein n=1 Tax=Gudongella sp. SC589 TaxID=3385990 RepID=UPI00390480ED
MSDGNGIIGGGGTTSISQNIVVSDTNPGSLYFEYQIVGNDGSFDGMYFSINGTEMRRWNGSSNGWQEYNIDLTDYRGESIEIKVTAYSLDSIISVYYYLDNFSVR